MNMLIKNALTSLLGALIVGAGGLYQSNRNARRINDDTLAAKRGAALAEMEDYWMTLTENSTEDEFNHYHALQHKYLNIGR